MKRRWIRRVWPLFMVFLATCLASVWLFQTATRHVDPVSVTVAPNIAPAPVASISENELPERFFDCIDNDDELFYQGYEVRAVTEPFKDEYTSHPTDVEYVVVKQNGKTVAKFDGVYHAWGNSAEFGLCDLLGGETKQLVIALSRSRGGRQVVVSLHPKFRVLLDSFDYDVGREVDDVSAMDIDKDGVFEILLPKVSFYGMEGLQSVAETPLTEIIFKYDAKQMKYLPANHLLSDFALRSVNLKPEEEIYKHRRFDVLLDYVFAGKEKEGWASFNEHYPSEDRKVMKSRIKAILRDDPVYKFIYQKRQR